MAAAAGVLTSCQQSSSGRDKLPMLQVGSSSTTFAPRSPSQLKSEVRIYQDLVPSGRFCRRVYRPMKPRYITLHSTQNWAASADACRHAKALKNGAIRGGRIGYMSWHFTVDENMAIQHVPCTEQCDHADLEGPGNRYSIGIEMCENKGSRLSATVDRAAKLTAVLMYQYNIPLSNVKPHYHWPRKGYNPPNKNCPHFLMENGRPGWKWNWFVNRVGRYHRAITTSV